jgi:hypothetical protein
MSPGPENWKYERGQESPGNWKYEHGQEKSVLDCPAR